jgi:hypothetical protein
MNSTGCLSGAWTGVVINTDVMAEELEDAVTAYRGIVAA